jgi:hypothetical protein
MNDAACCGSTTVASCRGSATVAACYASAATHNSSVVVAAGCGSETSAAPRESPLAAVVVLTVARDALDERRLVGTVASDLTPWQVREGARWAPPCEREGEKIKL